MNLTNALILVLSSFLALFTDIPVEEWVDNHTVQELAQQVSERSIFGSSEEIQDFYKSLDPSFAGDYIIYHDPNRGLILTGTNCGGNEISFPTGPEVDHCETCAEAYEMILRDDDHLNLWTSECESDLVQALDQICEICSDEGEISQERPDPEDPVISEPSN